MFMDDNKNFKKLYIIGNGFDLNHGLKTNYTDFKAWLKNYKPEI